MGCYHLSEWAESGRARHRAVAVAEIGTALQGMLKELRKEKRAIKTFYSMASLL